MLKNDLKSFSLLNFLSEGWNVRTFVLFSYKVTTPANILCMLIILVTEAIYLYSLNYSKHKYHKYLLTMRMLLLHFDNFFLSTKAGWKRSLCWFSFVMVTHLTFHATTFWYIELELRTRNLKLFVWPYIHLEVIWALLF